MFFKHFQRAEKVAVLTGDIFLVFTAYFMAVSTNVALSQSFNMEAALSPFNWFNALALLFCPVIFYTFELYEKDRWRHNIRLLTYISAAVIVASLTIMLFSLFFFPNIIHEKIVPLYVFFAIPLLFLWRKAFTAFFLWNGSRQQTILLVGEGPIIDDLKSLVPQANTGALIAMGDYSEQPGTVRLNGSYATKSLFDLVQDSQTNTVVVADQLNTLPILRKQLIDLRFAGVTIYDAPLYYQLLTGKVPVNRVTDSWFLFRNQGYTFNPPIYRKVKKIIDNCFAFLGVILSFPLMLLAAIAIKSTSKGPILFKQERLGQNEHPYTLIKFRTMIDNAEKLTGPQWASADDPRITKVGKILRKTRIDELPQLFNILKGDMSFVGPRPIRKIMADKLATDFPYYRLRFTVKPGLTGWAQVKGDYAGTKEGQFEKLQYELYYIQNQSILFDLFIILKTVRTVLCGRGT